MFRHKQGICFLSWKLFEFKHKWKKFPQIRLTFSLKSDNVQDKVLFIVKQNGCNDIYNWEKIRNEVLNVKHVTKFNQDYILFEVFKKNGLHDKTKSLMRYLSENNKLTKLCLMKFLELMNESPAHYVHYLPLVNKLYMKLLECDARMAKKCAAILLKSPVYFHNVFELYMKHLKEEPQHSYIIQILLSCNKLKEAFNLYLQSKQCNESNVILLEYLVETLKKKRIEFPVDEVIQQLITSLTDFPRFSTYHLKMNELMKLVNMGKGDYKWIMKSSIFEQNECIFCGESQLKTNITEEELQELLHNFEQEVILKNVLIKSFIKEWTTFVEFLETISYDIVIDGLNLYYSTEKCSMDEFLKVLEKVRKIKRSPLILTKKHFLRNIKKYNINNLCPVYYIENYHSDDYFILYAALKRGLGCWLMSRDKFGFLYSQLTVSNMELIEKWKATHFCNVSPNGCVLEPAGLESGKRVTQCEDPSEYKCHIIDYKKSKFPTIYCIIKKKKKKAL